VDPPRQALYPQAPAGRPAPNRTGPNPYPARPDPRPPFLPDIEPRDPRSSQRRVTKGHRVGGRRTAQRGRVWAQGACLFIPPKHPLIRPPKPLRRLAVSGPKTIYVKYFRRPGGSGILGSEQF